ncbi:hypothetical protein PTI98_000854 [Pleurotus ostreatus]|uniref:RING-type domain-containing protein n=1 Tax=Pleurotus ostreatus (strain PC15) TaxID=1137138 RepID=A0A067NSZ2_PLEO1|nr:hypothetical protein PTI98_000854 [Pleurotus ostreatus]KDQ31193.1 hypothetical protein PLEOSDRAFT_1102174 [Pleurotus ostreatus PC15]
MSSANRTQASTPKRASKMPSNQNLNLNHLLNFTLPPRQTQPANNLPRRSRKTANHGVWNKERFVNAQYRFVMNPTGDYTVHFADPDIFFQWQDILQVIIPRSSALASAGAGISQEEGHTSCPICLAPPTAPRMTKCGHVYCYPCILHYLNTSDNKWARCPICFDSVNEKQLKSVKWFDGPTHSYDDEPGDDAPSASSSVADNTLSATPREGALLRMRLMQRPQITTLALPRSHTWPSDLLPPHQAPFHFLPDVYDYAKFMLATPAYLIQDLTQDLDELMAERRTLASTNDELGIVFVESAEAKIHQQIVKASALESPHIKALINKARHEQREIEQRFADQERAKQYEVDPALDPSAEIPEEFLATRSTGFFAPPTLARIDVVQPPPSPNPNRATPKQRRNINPPPPSTSTYYYYQAASGLPIFLHPLDIKILFSHFNSYASFPDVITLRVEGLSEGSVNDDLRKRCKYLGHLPEGADVVFVEADLEGVVGKEGLKNFEGPLRMRRSRRKEKGRKDDRAKARAEERDRERDRETRNATNGQHSVRVDSHTYMAGYDLPAEVALSEAQPTEVQDSAPPPVSGAWGARSFASALHSAPGSTPRARQGPSRREAAQQDEWDIDVAWHELERGNTGGGGGGRKKRGTKLVVLGSGAGGRRR